MGKSRILNDFEQLLDHVEELTESGEYDLQAIMPLRRSAEENWAVPEARSRLRSQPTEATSETSPASPAPSPKFKGSSTADLLSTLGETSRAPSEFPPLSAPTPSYAAQSTPVRQEALTQPGPPPITREEGVALARGCTVAELREGSRPVAGESEQTLETVPGLEFDDPPPKSEGGSPLNERTSRSRKWLAAAGVLVVVSAWFVPRTTYQKLLGAQNQPGPRFVLGSEPKSEVYRGDTRLGETPLVLEAENVGDGLVLRRPGFEAYMFALDAPLDQDKVANFSVTLEESPIVLNWDGLPSGSKVVWNGKEIAPAKFLETPPGTYRLKVIVPERPPIELPVTAPDPNETGYQSEIALGQEVAKALAAQPRLKVSLNSKSANSPNSASLVVKEKKDAKDAFKLTAKVTPKSAKTLFLPSAGTYVVSADGGQGYLAFRQSVTLKGAESKSLDIVLKKKPPAPVPSRPARTSGGTSAAPYYAPAPQPYRAPPVYRAPRGGGAGRIAPPSF